MIHTAKMVKNILHSLFFNGNEGQSAKIYRRRRQQKKTGLHKTALQRPLSDEQKQMCGRFYPTSFIEKTTSLRQPAQLEDSPSVAPDMVKTQTTSVPLEPSCA